MAICIATAFTFLACEEKDKKAEAGTFTEASDGEANDDLAATKAPQDYSNALQRHYSKGTIGESGKTRPIEMFFQKVSKNGDSYSISGKSKTNAAEDAFSGILSISSETEGGSCDSGTIELKGSYNLNEKESKTSGSFTGTFTACTARHTGGLSKASFKGNWMKHASGDKTGDLTPCEFELSLKGEAGTFTDTRDGKIYKTVKIEEQVWMAENLNFKTEQSSCYGNDEANCEKYGRLYGCYGRYEECIGFCPKGWHLPSGEEWNILAWTVGGKDVAGKKLKSETGWENYEGKNGNGTDEFGFSALPGGFFSDYDGIYASVGSEARWWDQSIYNGSDYMDVNGGDTSSDRMSIRCVKD
jgi:uncharacterized protein (TIGR02145 family)